MRELYLGGLVQQEILNRLQRATQLVNVEFGRQVNAPCNATLQIQRKLFLTIASYF